MPKYILQLRAPDQDPSKQIMLRISDDWQRQYDKKWIQVVQFTNPERWADVEIVSVNGRPIPSVHRASLYNTPPMADETLLPAFRIRNDLTLDDFGHEWI